MILRLAAALLPVCLFGSEPAVLPLRNGGFEELDGWNLTGGAAAESRDGGRVLTLRSAGGSASATQVLALDPAWGTLRISCRVRIDAIAPGEADWHDARIALTFFTIDGSAIHRVAGQWRQADPAWREVAQLVAVPPGAVRLSVAPAIFATTGAWSIDDLRIVVAARRGEGIDADLPDGQTVTWGQEPVEAAGPRRAEVCLNGLWRFQPAAGPAATAPQDTGWGWLRVPGSWNDSHLPGVIRASGPAWDAFTAESAAGWYERELAIPAGWTGRAVVLDLRRVSTDAEVQIDGRPVGRVAWPGGEVALDAAVSPGRTHRLRIKVVAAADQGDVVRYMGMGEGQQIIEKARLDARGLIGDVLLACRPQGAHLDGLAIRTALDGVGPTEEGRGPQRARGATLVVEAGYRGLAAAGPLILTAVVRDGTGSEVRRFAKAVDASAGDGTVAASWAWDDPLLWDVGQPNLYRLELSVLGGGLDDALADTFGVREFRIDGKRFLLNRTEVRLRPAPVHAGHPIGGVRELIGSALDGLRWAGFNTHELWPWDRDERGTWHFDELWCEEADRRGFLLIAPLSDNAGLVGRWAKPGVADGWEGRMTRSMQRLRNHPSVVMWVTGANRFGHDQDQNPHAIGNRSRAWIADPGWRIGADVGLDALRRIRRHDPDRPVFMHAGGAVGDVYTSNNYLCLLPLQEREEWLSRWARDGDMPVLMVEFGTPLFTTFHRGRNGYGEAVVSEPLYSEFCAVYQGADAYRGELPGYRRALAATFVEGQVWRTWHGIEAARLHEGFNRLEALFMTATWRAWRTWGITGGMLPWSNGHGWLRDEGGPFGGPGQPEAPAAGLLPAFVPGRRGAWRPEAPLGLLRYFRPEGMPLTVAGRALVAANQETLAWIAGAPDFTDKTHHVRPGATFAKQLVVINDGRTAQSWSLTWSAEVAGRACAGGQLAGSLAPATQTLLPIAIRIPALAGPAPGVIRLACTFGQTRHEDAFSFTVLDGSGPAVAPVVLADPQGDTAAMLGRLQVASSPWDGRPADRLVVVGRNAFASGQLAPGALTSHLRAGGRVLLMAQDPEWMRQNLGLRVSRHLTRRAFQVIAGHPALAGLDSEGFRDWAGSSQLLPEADAGLDGRTPPFGWRWGSRHALSSAAIEIPHRAGWRPLLNCEFDGAYTPLAEVQTGGGAITVCMLDLEDHLEDPAAERVARAVLASAAGLASEARAAVTYLGGAAGAAELSEAGILHRPGAALPEGGLAIIGADATVDDDALDAFLRRGGRALVLPRRAAAAPLGVRLARVASHPGSLAVPEWASCRGLAPGELRRRCDGEAWTVAAGADAVGADGLLAEVRRGHGVAVFCQLDASGLDADRLSYNRLTRWRWTRVLCQLASNLGAACVGDGRLTEPVAPPERIALAGAWQARLTMPLPAAGEHDPRPADPGISEAARRLVTPTVDAGAVETVPVPRAWEAYGGAWAAADGEAVLRRMVDIPAGWAGRDLILGLGPVDDFDSTYFDGEQVGATDRTMANAWNIPRRYLIPARLVTPGKHLIAVRVFDHFGGGGLTGQPEQLELVPRQPRPASTSLYHADYRNDVPLGDEPYRYFRW